jgi:hypothetical protein
MRQTLRLAFPCLAFCLFLAAGCAPGAKKTEQSATPAQPPACHVDLTTAGSISGVIRYTGKRPIEKKIDMSEDPACVEAHHGKALDESLVVAPNGALANAFLYVKQGLEGKRFDPPSTPVTIDQRGCWFHPRVFGVQVNQEFDVVNSDPVTHNIHPMAMVNREWNHSQGAGDPPLKRHFTKPEVMIAVKCNIHRWMHAYIGVVDNPYFAVTGADGSFTIPNLPPGTYTIGIWQEDLGSQARQITVVPHANTQLNLSLKGQ